MPNDLLKIFWLLIVADFKVLVLKGRMFLAGDIVLFNCELRLPFLTQLKRITAVDWAAAYFPHNEGSKLVPGCLRFFLFNNSKSRISGNASVRPWQVGSLNQCSRVLEITQWKILSKLPSRGAYSKQSLSPDSQNTSCGTLKLSLHPKEKFVVLRLTFLLFSDNIFGGLGVSERQWCPWTNWREGAEVPANIHSS